jgi:hypothetical protein
MLRLETNKQTNKKLYSNFHEFVCADCGRRARDRIPRILARRTTKQADVHFKFCHSMIAKFATFFIGLALTAQLQNIASSRELLRTKSDGTFATFFTPSMAITSTVSSSASSRQVAVKMVRSILIPYSPIALW